MRAKMEIDFKDQVIVKRSLMRSPGIHGIRVPVRPIFISRYLILMTCSLPERWEISSQCRSITITYGKVRIARFSASRVPMLRDGSEEQIKSIEVTHRSNAGTNPGFKALIPARN